MRWNVVLLGVSILALTGCTAAAQSTPSTAPASTAAPKEVVAAPAADPPIDTSLRAISLSSMADDAKEAFAQCVGDGDEKLVAGMALLPSAREVPRYGWWFGKPPELQTDSQAWVIQFGGDVSTRFGIYHDPTCVVIDGVGTFYNTNGATRPDGKKTERSELAKPPELRLPPLEP